MRCSGCGAPRSEGPSCTHCGSSFAKYEQDLTSICPHCVTRVSDLARFCHSCGQGIAVDGAVGDLSDMICPACEGGEQHMHSRSLAQDLSLLECSGCAGLWIGTKTFDHVVRRAEEMVTNFTPERLDALDHARDSLAAGPVRYRPCPECKALMNRSQYGKYSRVIVDTCKQHGMWLDAGELTQILEWVRAGGLDSARARAHRQNTEQLKSMASSAAASERAMSSSMGYGPRSPHDSLFYRLFRL